MSGVAPSFQIFVRFLCFFSIVAALGGCADDDELVIVPPDPPATDTMTTLYYLALGDSYTIGESVDPEQRFPVIYADRRSNADTAVVTTIIARTGWTTDELSAGIDAREDELRDTYDLVSLLIGVNNQFRGRSLPNYREEFERLLQRAITFADGNPARVFVVSIPDYGVTPFGQASGDPARIAEELDAFNAAARSITEDYDVRFLDITPISREAADDPSLIANDNLHPSGEQYRRWVDEVLLPE